MTKQHLKIQGMHCTACALAVEGALEDLAGVQSATVHYARQTVDIEYDERRLKLELLIQAVEQAGYRAHV